MSAAGRLDTFPKLLIDNARRIGGRDALGEKAFGIWQSTTWSGLADQVRAFACGLTELGYRRGDKLAVIGDNRPALYAAMCAAQSLGGVPVPMYQDSVANELAFVLDHCEARFAVVEDQEQVDKLLEVKDRCPHLEHVIYCNARGLRHYRQPYLHAHAEVCQAGQRYHQSNPKFWVTEVEAGQGDDTCIILYTSGTTGTPKGVVLTFDNVIRMSTVGARFESLTVDERVLAYLPMAWVGDHIFSFAQSYIVGFCVSCPESTATVLDDLREIGPTYFFAPPRIYENLLTTVMIRMEDASALKRRMFHYFMRVAKRVGIALIDGRTVRLSDRLLYRLGDWLVYGPLKNTLGFSRIRVGYTAGEAIGPDIFDFYRSLGINMKQLYGQTESTVYVTIQPDGQIKSDTVGVPAPEVEVKIDASGEVLYRSPGVFREYYKNAQATGETKSPDGWVSTGDAGFFDEDGHLKIIDRAKDVGRLADGSLFAPKYIENKLKFFPHIKEAVAFGDQREHVAALVNIDLGSIGSWAERNSVSYASYQELAVDPRVIDLIARCVDNVNADLAGDEQLAGSQIKRFVVLHKELDADDGELTRTRKIRRRFIGERYQEIVEALYSDRTHCTANTEVTFEDGRTGSVRAELEIRDVQVVPALANVS